ncbi:DUF6985 domain-containing protein [Ferruginibacter sp.]
MKYFTFFIATVILYACNAGNNTAPATDNTKKGTPPPIQYDKKMTTRYKAFDTTVEVLFIDTKDSLNSIQQKNYEGFIAKQDLLTPGILDSIFAFYKRSYADYKDGWTTDGQITDQELEKYLPKPTTAQNLKKFITPAVVYIKSARNCEEGSFTIEFDCTWDNEEGGLGVSIKNWKVKEVGTAEIAYL